jgi:hypothetical protein
MTTGTLALTGNASAANVLSGRTFYDTDAKAKRTGTMPNQGAATVTLSPAGDQTLPAGYYSGITIPAGAPLQWRGYTLWNAVVASVMGTGTVTLPDVRGLNLDVPVMAKAGAISQTFGFMETGAQQLVSGLSLAATAPGGSRVRELAVLVTGVGADSITYQLHYDVGASTTDSVMIALSLYTV